MHDVTGRVSPAARLDYKWRALMAVAVGTFMSTLDSSIVNVSLPTLRSEFHTDITTVEWVAMAYMLMLTGLLLSVGRLSDMVGRKRVYNAGFVVFTLGSLACALSPGIALLIGARVLQAVGAAMLAANGAAILTAAFPRSERGKAMGLNGTIVGSGLTIGPPVGGLLLHAFGWRSIFTINLPIGVIGTLLGYYLLRDDAPAGKGERFDIPGALALLISLASLLLALSQGQDWGWSSQSIVALFTISAVALALFLAIESRVQHPTVDLSLFRNRLFSAGSVSALISYMGIATVIILIPFYLQDLRGYSTEHMGLMLTVIPVTMLFIAPFSGLLSDRIGSRFLSTLGMAIIAMGLGLLSPLADFTPFGIVWRLSLIGLGNGLFASPNSSAIMGAVPPKRLGVASGMISTVRTVGMVVGIAISGAVVAVHRAHLLAAGLPLARAYGGALGMAFLVTAGITVLGIVPSLVRGQEERRTV